MKSEPRNSNAESAKSRRAGDESNSKSEIRNGRRVIMRIELTPSAKAGLELYCHRLGKKQIAAMSRLVEWFLDQPETIQGLIQRGFPPSIAGDVAQLVLKRMVRP
jgi:hypothetical protein